MNAVLPFVGRKKEIEQLTRLHAQGKHVLIVGPPGVGKSALVAHLHDSLRFVLSERSATLGGICDGLEAELGLGAEGLRLVQRKQRLFKALPATGKTVVFDGVSWTTPKMSAFFSCLSERIPLWIGTRSEHPWDIGHFWPFLWKFARVELHPFHLADTRALVEAAVERRVVPRDARSIVEWLHHRSAGNPLILRELLDELSKGDYSLDHPQQLRLLDLDRRIHEVFPVPTGLAVQTKPEP
ncbi:MAG: AAA family ATPase [Verrucomicrobia bacterium]|nr:AAA family ATPase [Verrucomicrobiota bacterium]